MTSISYTALAGQTDFTVPFPFLREDSLSVELRGAVETDWTLQSGTIVRFGAGVVVNADDPVVISRATQTDTPEVDFADTSALRSSELERAFLQLLYALQEAGLDVGNTLRKNGAGTGWLAENLPIRNLADPTEDGDAVNLATLVNRLAGDGILPTPTADDFGKGIRIRTGAGGVASYRIGAVGGAFRYFKIPDQTTTLFAGQAFGYPIAKLGALATWTDQSTRIPFEIDETHAEPDGGPISLSGDYDIIVPRGTFEIEVEGSVRNLTQSTAANPLIFSGALTNNDGTTVYDRTLVGSLGIGGGAQNPPSPAGPQQPTFPLQQSAFIKMRAKVEALTGPQIVNVRLSGSAGAEAMVADTPFRVVVREVPV